jgi:dethiobiotin synthetase
MNGVFVTGTDTGCGKTEVSLALMAALQTRGLRVLGMKPVASGCNRTIAGLRNTDALRLQTQSSHPLSYDLINPYAFAPPIAPHIAAIEAGVLISLAAIEAAYRQLATASDLVVVEGVGGWRVPLAPALFVSDIPQRLELPVILVVGLKLGCLNHALLTADSVLASGNRLAGWIANQVEPDMPARDANLSSLTDLIAAPCLGVIPCLEQPSTTALLPYLAHLPI